ncbi:MAG: hypothetical protein JWR16_28, partial [Nevskia sp.]|nr:hypothetical protein [Nevskia sp.]
RKPSTARHPKVRVVNVDASSSARRPFRWTVSRLSIAGSVFAAPFVLLLIKLHAEFASGVSPGGANSVLIRFAVVGLFACLMTRWCITWMKRRR